MKLNKFIVLKVGCLECGKETYVIDVCETEEEAYKLLEEEEKKYEVSDEANSMYQIIVLKI